MMEQKINEALKKAMMSKDEAALRTLRAIKSAILLFKTSSEYKGELGIQDEIKILQKLAKQRKDAMAIFEAQNRPELKHKEAQELQIIQDYLPQPLSEEELRALIVNIQQQHNLVSYSDMGKLIGLVNKEVLGRAEGSVVSALVKSLLST